MTVFLKKSGIYVFLALVLLGVIFQVFFRYEYLAEPAAGIVRVDRLTNHACLLWPDRADFDRC